MRDVQFRAWDTREKKMYPVRGLGFEVDPTRIYVDDGGLTANTYAAGMRFKLMQYTDLQDKRGNRICEGDILNLVFGKHILEVRRGSFSFQFFEIAQQKQKLLYVSDLKQLEIIGNIYENAALLAREVQP